jgi:hypothetical protein
LKPPTEAAYFFIGVYADAVIDWRRGLLRRMSQLLALRVISRRRSNSVAFGAKRTFSEPRFQSRIYEYTP